MSVTKRQSFKYSIIGYLGFIIGALSSYFLFPFNFEFYGKLRYILTTAELFFPFVVFGISYANVKFFHPTKKEGKHQNLLSLSLGMIAINSLIFVGGFFLFHEFFPDKKSTELWKLKYYILPLVIILSFSAIFNKYISNYKRIAIPNIFENLFPKLGNILAFSLVLFFGFSEKIGTLTFLGMFFLALLGYAIYTNWLEKIQPNFNISYVKKKQLWKRILDYSFFGFLGTLGNYLAVRIDGYMIGEYIGFEANGIYMVIIAMISLISIPQMGVFNISAPIINKQIETNNWQELQKTHQSTSLALFFIGGLLFSCLVVGFPHLVHFIKNGNQLLIHLNIVWILGLATLFDLLTGFNGNIISMSKHYRVNIVFMLILASLTIGLNYYFIKFTNLGITGVAIATATSLTLYNILKLIFNQIKFNVHPFSIKMLWTLIICSLAISVGYFSPITPYEIVNLIYKPILAIAIILFGNSIAKIFPIQDYIKALFNKN